MHLRDFEDVPAPPYPGPAFKRIGLFFYLFSLSEEWVCVYLKTRGAYSDEYILKLPLRDRVKHWVKIASQEEPNNAHINYLCKCLNDLCDVRDALAHAFWQQHEEQLHGSFIRRRDRNIVTISGCDDLDRMVKKAKHCTAIINFWST